MHHRVRAVLGTIAALLVPGVASAEGEGKDVPRAAADASEPTEAASTAEPEAATDGAPAVVPLPPDDGAPRAAGERFTWKPFGFLRMQYRMVRNDPYVEFVGRDDGFELQNARVGVTGALASRVSYVLSIDGAVDERVQINVPEGKLRVGLKDAFVDVPVSGAVGVRAGYFETMVDPDVDGDTEREFVDRPLESRGVRATEGYQTQGLSPGRSLGAALRLDPGEPTGGAPRVGFELAVQNGADEYASNNDNDTPAASASAFARLPSHGLVVASARFNRRTEGELPFRQDEDDVQGSLGLRITAGAVGFSAGGMFVRTLFPTVNGPHRDGFGAHGALIVRTGGTVPLAFGYRFAVLDPSSLILTDRVMEHTAGVVLGVPRYRMRFQLQVTHVWEQRNLTNDRAQLAAEVSL